MQATRFPSRAQGPAERMTGFIAHLRMNGVTVGVRETSDAMKVLTAVDPTDAGAVRTALCALLVQDAESWRRFDDLFDAYWFNAGRQRQDTVRNDHIRVQSSRPTLWQPHFGDNADEGAGTSDQNAMTPSEGEDAAEGMDGRLIATRTENLSRRDLRELVDDDTLRQAEITARRLARAMTDRRSRRRRLSRKGPQLDMRRIQRASLARGGEPLDLFHRKRPDRPVQIVAFCDVSGSMTLYARVFLSFLKGLVDSGIRTDTYLFHTRLLRVTDALREQDTLRAASRLSLMAEGFGGGTDISGSLESFVTGYGARALNSRTVVLIISDGYCTSDPAALARVLTKIRHRARRIVWLNPLRGWQDHAPVAAAMQAALPHLDAHLPANTLEALAALEPEFRAL